jgi:ribosomal protein L10
MAESEMVRAGHGEKAETVAFVHEKFKTAKMAIVTEYRGLSVAQMTRLRRAIRTLRGISGD